MAEVRAKFRRTNPREHREFDQKVLDIRRVARVMAGGRRFSFRATVVIGNHKGKVGVGVAKGVDVSQAVEKAVFQAHKCLIMVPLTRQGTIAHRIIAKFSSAKVLLKPAPEGSGIIAGGAVRAVADLAGIRNLSSKVLSRSSNKLNNARATIKALSFIKAE